MNRFWADLMLLHANRVESRQSLPWATSDQQPPSTPHANVDGQPLLLQLKRLRLRLCADIGDGVLRAQ